MLGFPVGSGSQSDGRPVKRRCVESVHHGKFIPVGISEVDSREITTYPKTTRHALSNPSANDSNRKLYVLRNKSIKIDQMFTGLQEHTIETASNPGLVGTWTAAVNRSGYRAADFSIGDIFSAPDIKINLNPNFDATDNCISHSQFRPVFAKRRFWICLAKFEYHMLALPLFSFGGRGITAKKPEVHYQFAQLRDIRDLQWKQTIDGPPIEYDSLANKNFPTMGSSSVIHLAAARDFEYRSQIQPIGHIQKQSMPLLGKLYAQLLRKVASDALAHAEAEYRRELRHSLEHPRDQLRSLMNSAGCLGNQSSSMNANKNLDKVR